MGDAFKCDRCDALKSGIGNRRSKWVENEDGHTDHIRQDFCDRCDEIIGRVIDGDLTIDDFQLRGQGERP